MFTHAFMDNGVTGKSAFFWPIRGHARSDQPKKKAFIGVSQVQDEICIPTKEKLSEHLRMSIFRLIRACPIKFALVCVSVQYLGNYTVIGRQNSLEDSRLIPFDRQCLTLWHRANHWTPASLSISICASSMESGPPTISET
jgi:hypothetical protein